MKFSRSLQFNAVPEWSENYVAFQALKTLLHQQEAARSTTGSEATARQLEETFRSQYGAELKKVLEFYQGVHQEILLKYGDLQALVAEWNAAGESELKTVLTGSTRPSLPADAQLRLFKQANEVVATLTPEFPLKFDSQAKDVYLSLHDLHEYLYMNYTGFCKIAKSFEKHTGGKSGDAFVKQADSGLPMGDLTALDGMMVEIERAYARICCDNNLDEATVYLRHLLHERVIHERASVWQDMVAAEHKAHDITVVSTAPATATPAKKAAYDVKQLLSLALCISMFVGLWFAPIFQDKLLRRALAVLVTSAALWCTEALPLYIVVASSAALGLVAVLWLSPRRVRRTAAA